MSLTTILQVFIISILVVFYAYRIIGEKDRKIAINMINIGIEAAFIVIGMVFFTQYNHIYACRIIGTGLFVYGYTLLYFTLSIILNSEKPKILCSFAFFMSTVEFVTEVSIDAFMGDNIGNYFFYPSFERKDLYYLRYSISCFSLFRMQVIVYLLYRRALKKEHDDLYYYTRLKFGMYGFLFPVISTVVVFINLWLTYPFGELFRPPLYRVSTFLGIIGDIFLFMSVLAEPIFNKIAYPSVLFFRWRRDWLSLYLHSKYIVLVERVHLGNTRLLLDRVVYEITEAREYVWSHIPHTAPLTAKEEAKHLFVFLQNQCVFHEAGPYARPPVECTTMTYNYQVAKYLKRCERIHLVQMLLLFPFIHIRTLGTRGKLI